MFKVNNKDTRTMPSLIVNFEHKSVCSIVSIVNFEQVHAGWAVFHYLFQVSNENTRAMCEIWLKLIIKTPYDDWSLSIHPENIKNSFSDIFGWFRKKLYVLLVSLLLTFNRFCTIFWSLECWLWTSKNWLDEWKFIGNYDDCRLVNNPEYSENMHILKT